MEIKLDRPGNVLDWVRIYALYLTAFPPSERKPFSIIRKMYRQGRSDVWCILHRGKFAGLAATVNGTDTVLLDYLAVSKSCRGLGVGSASMAALMEIYRDKGFFVEIETTREACNNLEERLRRRNFYLAVGMEDLQVSARVFGVKMDLLGVRCRMTFRDYQNFYREHYSPWAAEHLEEI